jgi:hypothetical protein
MGRLSCAANDPADITSFFEPFGARFASSDNSARAPKRVRFTAEGLRLSRCSKSHTIGAMEDAGAPGAEKM